jgi:hypothetical protein
VLKVALEGAGNFESVSVITARKAIENYEADMAKAAVLAMLYGAPHTALRDGAPVRPYCSIITHGNIKTKAASPLK